MDSFLRVGWRLRLVGLGGKKDGWPVGSGMSCSMEGLSCHGPMRICFE